AELLPKLFDLFVQGRQGVDRSQGGLGIGLSLVRTLVRLHRGRVEAHSPGPGAGSTFTVRLPAVRLGADGPEAAPRPQRPPQAARRRRVLVVDDNRDAADLVAQALASAGHEVRTAADGPQALQAARELKPEVAIIDIGLPVMDGYEVATLIRA